jgi:Flp pilus assembly protein TadG
MKLIKKQLGLTTVEFALVAVLLFTMIFGVIEIARAFFVTSLLDEATRRGARVAVVCPINDPAIFQAAAFNSTLIPDLDAGDITVEYLDDAGAVVANSTDPAGFRTIAYVRVRVVGYQHQMFIPFLMTTFFMPEYTTVLPRESLGIPRDGVIVPC